MLVRHLSWCNKPHCAEYGATEESKHEVDSVRFVATKAQQEDETLAEQHEADELRHSFKNRNER